MSISSQTKTRNHWGIYVLGEVECDGFLAAVPFWSLLFLLETEGAGMSQYRVDC